MPTPALRNFEILPNNSFAIRPPGYVDTVVLAANVAKTVTIPTVSNIKANYVFLNATANFYAQYIETTDSTNLVTNGTFASDTAWTKGAGWTIAAGKGTSDASQSADSDLSQTPTEALVQGRAYFVTFTTSGRTAGNVTAVVGSTEGTDRATNATFTETIIAGAGATIALRADLDFDGSVDNFSVAPVATVPAADNSYGSGVELNPTARFLTNVSQISLASPSACIITLSYYI